MRGLRAIEIAMSADDSYMFWVVSSFIVLTGLATDAGADRAVYCHQSSFKVGGAPTASGGLEPYVFSWTGDGAVYLSDRAHSNPTFDVGTAGPGVYNLCVTVTDANEASATDCMIVTVNSALVVAASEEPHWVEHPVKPILRRGVGCWDVYEACERLKANWSFGKHMTGPGGRLVLRIEPGGQQWVIRPSDLWNLYMERLDTDNDRDLDLRDYARWQLKETGVDDENKSLQQISPFDEDGNPKEIQPPSFPKGERDD